MNQTLTIDRPFHVEQRARGRQELCHGHVETPVVGRVPRVARLLALAIRLDELIREGVVADQAEIARLGHVTRARVSQIFNLLNLSPRIQERLLLLPPVTRGPDPITEAALRPIAALLDWNAQERLWRQISRAN